MRPNVLLHARGIGNDAQQCFRILEMEGSVKKTSGLRGKL